MRGRERGVGKGRDVRKESVEGEEGADGKGRGEWKESGEGEGK